MGHSVKLGRDQEGADKGEYFIQEQLSSAALQGQKGFRQVYGLYSSTNG